MGSDTNHRGGRQPILHVGSASEGPGLEPCSDHWKRQSGAKCRGNNTPWISCSTGGILPMAMVPEGLGRVDGQREGIGALKCLLPTTILPIRPSAPPNGIAPTRRLALVVDCRGGRRQFLTTLTGQQKQRLGDKKVDWLYGSRYHDRSISNRLHSSETQTLPEIYH